MSRFDNAPPVAGWTPQPGRHCGQNCIDFTCEVCGEHVAVPMNVILADN